MSSKERELKIKKMNHQLYIQLVRKIKEEFGCKDNFMLPEDRLFLLEGEYSTVCFFGGNAERLDGILKNLEHAGIHPYCVGIPLVILDYINRKEFDFRPLTYLATFLTDCRNKIILKDKLGEKLTYGKQIEMNIEDLNVSEYITKKSSERSTFLVYTESGLFLAFARIIIVSKKARIVPVLDVGWYLRRGE
jgi:ribosome biogenesis protein Nip4